MTPTVRERLAKQHRWDLRFLQLAQLLSSWSKDPSTKVGCVVVGPDLEIRSTGFNGFPRGVSDDGRLDDRESKYPIIVHAEENAIMNAARIGVSLRGCTLYCTWTPCPRCARGLIQVGVTRVVVPEHEVPVRWQHEFGLTVDLLQEASVKLEQVAIDDEASDGAPAGG